MDRWIVRGTLALALALASCAPRGSLVRDGGFEHGIGAMRASRPMPAGVVAEWAPRGGREGGGAVRLRVADSTAATHARWSLALSRVPAERDVRFSAWVRTAPGTAVPVMEARAIARNGSVQGFETTEGAPVLSPETGWVLIGATLTTVPSVHRVEVWLSMPGPGEAWIDDVAVEALPASEPR